MADVTRATVLPTRAIIPFSASVQSELATGLSTGSYGFIIHNPANEVLAGQLADGVNILTIVSNKTTIVADGIEEATITCIELPTNMEYKIYREGVLHLSGSIVDGSIEYSTNTPGVYVFEITEPGTHNTGYVQLEVV